METKPQLTSLQGRLIDTYPRFQPETIQHASEIMNERRDNDGLRNQWFRTADFPMYNVENGKPILYLAGREHNLLFRNLEEAVKQIRKTQNYKPTKEGVKEVLESAKKGETLKVNILGLELENDNDEWKHFTINTEDYGELNKPQKAFVQRVYGKGKDFSKNMKMLKEEARIDNTRIYVLNPDYVMKHAKDNPIARVSWLDDFGDCSYFDAVAGLVDNDSDCLRGVRKVAEGDAAKKPASSLNLSALEKEILITSIRYVPEFAQNDYKKAIKAVLDKYQK